MVKRVLKYGTGQDIPEGAVYLCTKKQTECASTTGTAKGCWYIWHYFLVECDE